MFACPLMRISFCVATYFGLEISEMNEKLARLVKMILEDLLWLPRFYIGFKGRQVVQRLHHFYPDISSADHLLRTVWAAKISQSQRA